MADTLGLGLLEGTFKTEQAYEEFYIAIKSYGAVKNNTWKSAYEAIFLLSHQKNFFRPEHLKTDFDNLIFGRTGTTFGRYRNLQKTMQSN